MILAITPPSKFDYLATTVIEGLQELGIDLRCTGRGNGERVKISSEEFKSLKDKADFIFLIHGKIPGDYNLIAEEDWNKVVIIDGSEWSFNCYPPFGIDRLVNHNFLEKAKYYFKRECFPEHLQLGIRPLPFGAVKSDFGNYNSVKDIDILCSFGQNKSYTTDKDSTQWRQVAIDATKKLEKLGYKVIYKKVNNYFEHINRSWLTVDAYGGGECNGRTFQIPANKSLALYKRFKIIIPNLTENEHYIGWDSSEEFIENAKRILDNKEKITYLIKNSYENLIKYHTSTKRAEYILSEINFK